MLGADGHLLVRKFNRLGEIARFDGDALLLEMRAQAFYHPRVRLRQEIVGEDGYFAPEGGIDRRKLKSDDAAADDDEALGNFART